MENIEFKGNCAGVRLVPRGRNDIHICFVILAEDDGEWYESNNFSSSWCEELIEQLQHAHDFMKTQEPDIFDGKQFGWNFKF